MTRLLWWVLKKISLFKILSFTCMLIVGYRLKLGDCLVNLWNFMWGLAILWSWGLLSVGRLINLGGCVITCLQELKLLRILWLVDMLGIKGLWRHWSFSARCRDEGFSLVNLQWWVWVECHCSHNNYWHVLQVWSYRKGYSSVSGITHNNRIIMLELHYNITFHEWLWEKSNRLLLKAWSLRFKARPFKFYWSFNCL